MSPNIFMQAAVDEIWSKDKVRIIKFYKELKFRMILKKADQDLS
jgi:hypothetical protein